MRLQQQQCAAAVGGIVGNAELARGQFGQRLDLFGVDADREIHRISHPADLVATVLELRVQIRAVLVACWHQGRQQTAPHWAEHNRRTQ